MLIDASEYTDRLNRIYQKIDNAYQELAREYGDFSCEGCPDLCCNNVFLHFTLIEHIYLAEGFRTLPEETRNEIIERSKAYNKAYSTTSRPEENLKMLCPLNNDSKCILYRWRPLACRFYGLPGTMESPTRGTQEFKGCWRFESLHGDNIKVRLDRTPFYREVADLEKALRDHLRYYQRYRKTIAQMILDEASTEGIITRGYHGFEGY